MRIITLLALLVLISGCKKGKGDITLKGEVTDLSFNTSLVSCQVQLFEISPGGSPVTLINSMQSTDGTYSFTFPRNKVEGYKIVISKQNYFGIESTISLNDLSIEQENIRNYSTTAKAWAALRFINDSPQPFDQLTFTKQQGKVACEDCCPTAEQNLYGAVDTTIYCINDGNTVYSYLYYVSGGSNGIKSVNTTAFDTLEILLQY